MAKVIVFDLDGVAHEKETVDARECVTTLGWSMTESFKSKVIEQVEDPKKRGRPAKDE